MAAASSRMKRKQVGEVTDDDDFSDFSLSSPALKIRRLDAIHSPPSPILGEEYSKYEQERVADVPRQQQSSVVIEELPPDDEERAIVVFKPPVYGPTTARPPSTSSFSVDSKFVAGVQSRLLKSKYDRDNWRFGDEEEQRNVSKEHLAVVAWVPSQVPVLRDLNQARVSELMESDAMDIEEQSGSGVDTSSPGTYSYGFPQCQQQQQHCLMPHLPHTVSTPITWFH